MSLYKIITPNREFTGPRAGLDFVCGQAVTADRAAAGACEVLGYLVIEMPDDLPSLEDRRDESTAPDPAPIGAQSTPAPEPEPEQLPRADAPKRARKH